MTDYSHELVDDARLSHMNTADVFKCPSCGFVGCVVEYHQNGGGFWDLDIPCDCEPRFCPECGERMVGECLKSFKRWLKGKEEKGEER